MLEVTLYKYCIPKWPSFRKASLQVTFIDYGNSQTVPLSCLMNLSSSECKLPAQAMECYLTCVRPSASSAAEGTWSEDANFRLEEIVKDKRLVAKVCGSTLPL